MNSSIAALSVNAVADELKPRPRRKLPGHFDQKQKTYCETEAEDNEKPSQEIHVPPIGADLDAA
jgi:hypothetical protein